jgi:exonuclease III
LVLCGDYNVIPEARDARFPAELEATMRLFLPQTRAAFRELESQGLTEAYRALHPLKTGGLQLLGLSGGCLAEGQRHPH